MHTIEIGVLEFPDIDEPVIALEPEFGHCSPHGVDADVDLVSRGRVIDPDLYAVICKPSGTR